MHPALAPYVAALTAYDVDLGAPGVHRGLPGTTLTFVLPVGEPLDVGWQGVPGSRARRWSTVSGLHAHPAEIHHDGTQAGVQLGLTPAGALALLGVPAGALAGELVELPDVAPTLRHLPERLAATAATHREAVVEAALLACLRERDAVRTRPEVGHALARLTRGAGVQEVADEVGYSRRHLGALVRRECGLTPQEVRRVGRFERSRTLLGRVPLAEAAQRCGYADQAHLTREWVALAGCPPTTWLREEFPFLQDLGGPSAEE
ncbi:helix-turn-helix domain-containing protein [Nocardioides sp. MAH-18]|uniref:Helix-turn-helix domain-containing protein n=1 Tax=Nocardioides agri TaxID=2682843 RepID=A0A6L6XLE6_9ACTN|nr:AraC family transcriptional regulator [Nocardioides sp. CGMCC 1.13656]MVQ47573.1 helix-turn-helix domain-containing protein [Nocardioides sp. MAH-18]